MREIKFRAWNGKRLSQPFGFENIDGEDGHEGYIQTVGEKWEQIEAGDITNGKETLMQFTGLHDKNGKEIYEGDIVGGKGQKTYEVTWTAPSFQSVSVKDRYDWNTGIPSWLEVIGNIYENPELLTK